MDWNGLEWIGIYNRFGLWTMEWITAEEAERLANDGDPILEPVSLAIIIYDHICFIFTIIGNITFFICYIFTIIAILVIV